LHGEIEYKNEKILSCVFFVIFLTNLMINVDHGILPASTLEIREDLNITNVDIGVLGSLVYLGLVAGKKISFIL